MKTNRYFIASVKAHRGTANGVTYISAGEYYADLKLRELAHGIKNSEPEAISEAARIMSKLIPNDAIVVPMPSRSGKSTTMLKLAKAIASIKGGSVEVIDAIRGLPRESQYDIKKRGEKLTVKDMGFKSVADVPSDRPVVVIDNVVASGTTGLAAIRAIPNAHIVTLAHDTTGGRGLKNKKIAFRLIRNMVIAKILIAAGFEDQKPYLIETLKKHNVKDDEIEEVLENIQKADPVSVKTKGRKSPFTKQITEWYVNKKIRLPEDVDTIKETLIQFNKYKGQIKKKIDRFNSPGDLRKELEEYTENPDAKDYSSGARILIAGDLTPENIFDAKDGIGAVPHNQDVGHFGFVKKMSAPEFRRLAMNGKIGKESKEYVVDQLKQGKKIGQPFLNVDWDEDLGKWLVVSHEGRSRSDAFRELFGNSAKMEVHIFPCGLRAANISPEMKAAEFVPEGQS